jgi:hypothetical protein
MLAGGRGIFGPRLRRWLGMHQDLIIVRCGAGSQHGNWLDRERHYDVIIFGYEPLPAHLTDGAAEVIIMPGPKVVCWQKLLQTRPEILTRYQQIALLDDDLAGSAADINKLFAYGRSRGLSLWQPSLSWDSYFSYAVTLHNPTFRLRYVNFVEMMCPFFSAEQLRRALPLFGLGYEVNIDRLWCRLRPDWCKAYAIVDEVQFRHTRPVGLSAAAQGFGDGLRHRSGNRYQSMIDRAEQETGLYFRGPVAYAGEARNGQAINGRFAMALRTAALLRAARHRVNHRFYRPVADHLRHILTRPIDNEPIDLSLVTARVHEARAGS